jgi:glyoxylase-like metal-dependent hydrolase (beta-lactamase superfamily II)
MTELKFAIVPVTPFAQNCTLLWDEASKRGAIVDPGGDIDRLVAEIDKRGIRIEKILITHGHIDHAGGAADLARRLQVPIEGPQQEDVMNCLNSEDADLKESAQEFLQALLDNRYTHTLVREVSKEEDAESIVLEEGQRLIEVYDEDKPNISYAILERIEDTNCRLFKLGFSIDEAQSLLQ